MLSRLLIIAYVALHLAPALISERYLEQLGVLNFAGRRWDLNLLLISALFVTLLQLTLSLIVIKKIASWREGIEAISGRMVILLLYLPVLFLELLIFISWGYFEFSGSFLNTESLWIRHFIFDTKAIGLVSVGSDWERILFWLGLGILGFTLQLLLHRSLLKVKVSKLYRHLLCQAVIVIGVNGAALIFAVTHGVDSFLSIARGCIWPQYAIIYRLTSPSDYYRTIDRIPSESEQAVRPLEFVQNHSVRADAPNIILIVVEALRYDALEAKLSDGWAMPNLRELGSQGVSFPRAYAQAPETDYSQVTILTGQYPLRFASRDLRLDLKYPHILLFDLLHHYGYKTGHFTNEWTVTRRQTISPSLDLYFNPTDPITPTVRELLGTEYSDFKSFEDLSTAEMDQIKVKLFERWINTKNSEPIFAKLFLYASHFPYEIVPPIQSVEGEVYSVNIPYSFYGYDKSLSAAMRARFHSTLRYIDSMIGMIKQAASVGKNQRETVLIITGDHGELFGEHGLVTHAGHLCPEVLHVPLIFWSSKNQIAHLGLDSVVGHIDIAPSILSYLSLPSFNLHQGEALIGFDSLNQMNLIERPLFASVQTFVTENSVIKWPWMYNGNLVCGPLINLEKRALVQSNQEIEVQAALRKEIEKFTRLQLGHYSLHKVDPNAWYAPPNYK